MKNIILRSTLFLAATGLLVMTGCEKIVDDAVETTASAEDATSDMLALSTLTDGIQDIIDNDPNLQLKNGSIIIPRENFSYVDNDSVFTDNDGIVIKFDFEAGASSKYTDISSDPAVGTGTACGDGTVRWGNGTISISKPIDQDGAELTVALSNYIILKDGIYYQIGQGSQPKDIILTRETGKWKLDYDLSFNSRISIETETSGKSFGDGTFYVANTDGGQAGLLDDEITVTGGSSNINKDGKKYTLAITDPLFRKADPTCSKTFISGKMELKNEGSNFDIKIEFGDGTCDNDVVVFLPGNVKKTITVK